MNAGRGRARLIRFALSIPLAFVVVSGLTMAGAAGSCVNDWAVSARCTGADGGGGGGGGGGGAQVSRSFSFNRYYDDGRYGAVQTITGHASYSDGTKRLFDTLYSTSSLHELCLPSGAQLDGYYFGRPLVSPETTYPEGGYTEGLLACIEGQALVWEWNWNWANESPHVEPYTDGGLACRKIRAPLFHAWEDSYGWCED